MGYTLKSPRHSNCHYNEKLRKSAGLAFTGGKQGLICRAMVSTHLASSFWGGHTLPVAKVIRTFVRPERSGLASMTHW